MRKYKTIFSALFVMLLWGSLFPVVKISYGLYNVSSVGDILVFAGIRFAVCGFVICLYTFITDKESYKSAKQSIVPVLLSGLIAIVLHYAFTYCAMMFAESSKTAILKQIGVLFYVCFSFLFFKDDRLTVSKLIGVLVGFAGIVAINADSGGVSFGIGDALIIAASFCTVFSNVISKKVFRSVKPVTSTGVSQLFGGLILLFVGKLMGGSVTFRCDMSILIMFYICIASTFSYCIWYSIVKSGELSKLFIIKFAEPMFACVFGAVILGENVFNLQYLTAFFLISLGIFVSNKQKI